jgi:hypothetical protein
MHYETLNSNALSNHHFYRFFSGGLAILPRTVVVDLGALGGSAKRAPAALVRRTPG